MIINKITTGFVIQTFDTEKKQYTAQAFTAGEVDYEDQAGNPVSSSLMAVNPDGSEPYLPFDMVQPRKTGHVFNHDTGHCIKCNCDEDDAFVGGELCIDEHEFEIGDRVVATPDMDDDWTEFTGVVDGFKDYGKLITVKDQAYDGFDCRPGQLELAEDTE